MHYLDAFRRRLSISEPYAMDLELFQLLQQHPGVGLLIKQVHQGYAR